MYSTPASAIAAIMASPLSSAGTSVQARLSLRNGPACLFMGGLPGAEFADLGAIGQAACLRLGGMPLRSRQGGQPMNTMRQALIVGLLLSLALPAQAQLNPSRQITIVVPIGAGGGVDAVGRLIAEKFAERLKQPVVVENRPAAGGMVGTDSVAKAAPDG